MSLHETPRGSSLLRGRPRRRHSSGRKGRERVPQRRLSPGGGAFNSREAQRLGSCSDPGSDFHQSPKERMTPGQREGTYLLCDLGRLPPLHCASVRASCVGRRPGWARLSGGATVTQPHLPWAQVWGRVVHVPTVCCL